jgi:hypothetical protein
MFALTCILQSVAPYSILLQMIDTINRLEQGRELSMIMGPAQRIDMAPHYFLVQIYGSTACMNHLAAVNLEYSLGTPQFVLPGSSIYNPAYAEDIPTCSGRFCLCVFKFHLATLQEIAGVDVERPRVFVSYDDLSIVGTPEFQNNRTEMCEGLGNFPLAIEPGTLVCEPIELNLTTTTPVYLADYHGNPFSYLFTGASTWSFSSMSFQWDDFTNHIKMFLVY